MEIVHTPKQDLHYASESISQSIALGVERFSHFAERLSTLLPDVISAFKGSNELANLPKVVQLQGDQKSFVELMLKHSYLEVREIKAYVAAGQDGTFLDILNELRAHAERCTQLQANELDPYVMFLAHLCSNGEALKATDDGSTHNLMLASSRDTLNEQFGAHFKSSNHDGRARLGQVLARQADWPAVFTDLNAVIRMMESVQRTKIDQLMKQAEDYLEIIYSKVQKGEFANVNPEVCKALADGAYQVACEIEFLSVTYFRVLQQRGAIEHTVAEVQRVLDNVAKK